MLDLSETVSAEFLGFLSDASAKETLGFGCVFGNKWIFAMWEPNYISKYKPSIEYLELYALVAGILTWEFDLKNIRMIVKCDNQAVVCMVNKLSSSCPHCILVLNNLKFKRRIFAQFLGTKQNFLADSLSRGKLSKFFSLAPSLVNRSPDQISELIWPASKIWMDFD